MVSCGYCSYNDNYPESHHVLVQLDKSLDSINSIANNDMDTTSVPHENIALVLGSVVGTISIIIYVCIITILCAF